MRGVDPLAIDEPLTQALRTLAVDGFTVGTPSRLHAALEGLVEPADLPRDAAKLARVLAVSPSVLSDAGVVVRRHKRQGVRLVQLVAVTPAPVPEVVVPAEPVKPVEPAVDVPVVPVAAPWSVGRHMCPGCGMVLVEGVVHTRGVCAEERSVFKALLEAQETMSRWRPLGAVLREAGL